MNSRPFNSDKNLLIADSVSLSCISGLKKIKMLIL